MSPEDDSAYYGLASVQYIMKQYDKAKENCEKALSLNSDNTNALILQRMIKERMNR
jgi:tetratricopeptide (TPR) repeat protein